MFPFAAFTRMYGAAPRKVKRPICSPRSIDSSRNACDSFSAMARKAETGVSRSALIDLTTGTSVASRASRENCFKSGCSMWVFHYRGHPVVQMSVGSHQHTPFLPHSARGRGFSKLWLLGWVRLKRYNFLLSTIRGVLAP